MITEYLLRNKHLKNKKNMKETFKLITLRIDGSDYELIKLVQENLKITSINSVIKQIIYSNDSIYDLYDKSVKFKKQSSNNLKEN